MGRKKVSEAKALNRIADEMKKNHVKNQLIAIWTGVNIKTVSTWRNNTSQPSEEKLDQLGELFEIHTGLLRNSFHRIRTGLAAALQKELKRLLDEEKIAFEVEIEDENSTGRSKIINPELITKIEKFAQEFKKTHKKLEPRFVEKLYDEIGKAELRNLGTFICIAKSDSRLAGFDYLVVNESLGDNKFVARFARKEDAEAYVDWLEKAV